MNLVCYVYKRELEASSNAIRSLFSKSSKYSWAKEAHDAAIQEREFMANVLFEQLINVDEERYYYTLFTSAVDEQISNLMSQL